jgi:hypothetical protein
MVIKMINKMKDGIYEHLNEIKENRNKQSEYKENTNK